MRIVLISVALFTFSWSASVAQQSCDRAELDCRDGFRRIISECYESAEGGYCSDLTSALDASCSEQASLCRGGDNNSSGELPAASACEIIRYDPRREEYVRDRIGAAPGLKVGEVCTAPTASGRNTRYGHGVL